MTWTQTMSNRMTRGFATLVRLVPALSAAPTYEYAGDDGTCLPAPQTNRNRWSRTDLTSAIGHDPSVTDPAVQVWPQRRRRD